MRKSLLAALFSILISGSLMQESRAQLTSLTEGFDTVGSAGPPATGIYAAGWQTINNSNPLGDNKWAQGIPGNAVDGLGANAQSGAPNSFIQTNFNAGGASAIVSDWLITPVLLLENGATMSFYTQAATVNTTFPNELQVWESQSGSSTVDVGSTAATPGGDFTVKLLDINPGATNPSGVPGGYPTTWTQFTFTISGLSGPTDGRFGFRYYLPNNTTDGTNIGIDTFAFADPPPVTTFTRTVSGGNWTDTTGWTPNGVPNGTTVTAQLVNPGSGTNTVNLGGGIFTVNQLQFSGTNAGTWNVTNGTIVFDGTNPMFLNQGDSGALVGTLANLQLNATTTFEIDNAAAVTDVTGVISGTGGLIKTGNGTLMLIGANTYGGGTTISVGTLEIGNGGTTGSITGDVTDNATVEFNRSNTVTFAGVISGTGGLVQAGTGTLILTANNTFAGGSTVDAGTLQVGDGTNAASLTGANGAAGQSGGNAVTVNNSAAVSVMASATITGGGGGAGATGNGGNGGVAVTFTAAGTLTNGGTVSGGNGGNGAPGNAGGNGADAVDFGAGGTLTNSGTISGGTGGTGVTNGTTGFGAAFAGAAGTFTNETGGVINGGVTMGNFVNSVTLDIGSTINGSLNIGTSTTATLTLDGTGTQLYSAAVTGVTTFNGALIKNGTGTWTLDKSFSYAGGTTINTGTLQVGNGGTTGSITGNVANNAALVFDRSDSVTFDGAITGTGSLTQSGGGTLTLSGNNTYRGVTTIASGTLRAGSLTGLSQNSAFTVNSVLDLNGFSETIASLAGATTGIVTNTSATAGTLTAGGDNTNTTFSGTITGNLQFTKTGTGNLILTGANTHTGGTTITGGTLILTGTNTYTGGTTITSGTLQIGNDTTTGSITGDITDNAHLIFDRSNTIAFGGSISGTGTVTQNGSTGTLVLSGNNIYSGATAVNAGTLQAGSTTAFSAHSAYTVLSVLDLNGFSNSIGSLAGSGTVFSNGPTTATLTVGADNMDTTFSGRIQNGVGFLALTKMGAGTLTLTSVQNTYTRGTNLNGGILAVNSDNDLGFGPLSFNGGTLEALTAGGGIISNKAITLNADGGTFLADAATNSTLIGNITGSGSFTKDGPGILILSGNNTYNGATIVASGILRAGSPAGLSQNSAFTVNSELDLNGFSETIDSLAGASTGTVTNTGVAPSTLTVGGDNTSQTFSGIITGNLELTKAGAGNLILTGTNTYTGGTNITSGTLQIGNGTASGSIIDNVTDNGLLAFDELGNVIFAGTISGSGNLQNAAGTLILTADNTFTGNTTISPGSTVQLGNGGLTGSVTGDVVDNGTLSFNRSNTLNYSGVISGTGSVQQNGTGTTILSGANTYSGGTIVNAGTLTVNNAQALGLGNVEVNGGILNADPQPINVAGNYTQNAGGTLQLQVAGASAGQYDYLNVRGSASLAGTLKLLSLGYQPKAGDQLTLVLAGGMISGRFATFLDPFSKGPAFNTVDLVYGKNSVLLEFLNMSVPVTPPIQPPAPAPVPVIVTIDFESFGLTPNERAAGNLLDKIELDPAAHDLIAFLGKESVFNLAGDLERISPETLTAFYEITFSNANIQRLNLEGRLDDLHSGSNGFSSNMKLNGTTVNLEDKATVDGQSSKSPLEQALQPGPENRWGVWVTGFGDFVNVESDSNANGYDFTTGGFTLGVDYRINNQLAIGAMGEYSHTWTSLKPSGNIDVDSGRGGVYASWFNHGFYLDAGIYGGHNSYSSSRSSLGGMASGGTEGAEYSMFVSGGYDWHCGHLILGPIAALQYTYAGIDSFNEHGSLAPLNIHSQSAESLRTDIGLRASYIWQIGNVVVEPSLRAAWEHEYKYSDLPIAASFVGIPGPSATFLGPSEGHDSAIVSAGVSVHWTPTIATYVAYDGQLGRNRYDSNAVTGGVRISF